jgi:STE24 endopeptidase
MYRFAGSDEFPVISPGPLEQIIFHDHPSGRDRVYRAMLWKSENMDDEPASD